MSLFNTNKGPERIVLGGFLLLGATFISLLLIGLILSESSLLSILTFVPLATIFWLLVTFHVKRQLESHLYSLANVIESLRIGDYSLRVVNGEKSGAWSDVFSEINKLAENSRSDRWQTIESNILLDKLLAQFEIPVFIFDRDNILQNLNDRSSGLFLQDKEQLIGLHAKQINLQPIIDCQSGEVIEHWFPNKGGRWEISKSTFMQEGKRLTLLFVNDLSQALREEERSAWQKLIRVLGHELNNSLASIISVSDNLRSKAATNQPLTDQHSLKAISVITERSHSLMRFTEAYTRLAKLPEPNKHTIDIKIILERIINLVDGHFVLKFDAATTIDADADQLEQMLINLLKNAVEASSTESEVKIIVNSYEQGMRIDIIDRGSGLPSSDNLFVPFFTTKPDGSGIGLFLCRQIAEAHNGTLILVNNEGGPGCTAKIWLPKKMPG